MAIKLTETQTELLNLLYANVVNANEYCEALLSDGDLFKGIKEECIRPVHVKVKWLKQSLGLKVPRDKVKDRDVAFSDPLVYDEVARLMSYMTPEKRQQVEDFAKSILA
jgi:hypothetical protein